MQFQPDTLSTTTGDGTFGSCLTEDVIVDPLPHDRPYFEDHLTFLNNYYSKISNGKVTVDTFRVYPLDSDSVYTLPHQMWHYNHNTTEEDLNLRLTWLFQDAWAAASADSDIDFDEWDTFIIFHAGVGQDFNVSFDETPHDIPSAFFRLENLQEALEDPDYQGVLVDTTGVDSSFVSSGMLLPECEHQYEVDVEIAMNGTEALLFGQWIGIPALYNTEDGSSGVGRFDLMDQGSGNFAGMAPSRPCAWTRVFMGWESAELLYPDNQSDTLSVNITGYGDIINPTQHEIYRVNINESEYFLIENRSWNPDSVMGYWSPDSLAYTIARDRFGNELYLKEDYSVEKKNADFGVIVEVDNYDFGLPGEGVLIWHVDDSVIEANYADNTVNNDLSHRGVALVEADGAEDIGQEYGFLDIGYGAEYGWSGDFFFAGNQAFLDANPNLSAVRFYDDSHPETRAYDGSPTGIMIGGFTARDTVMQFWIKNDWSQAGFPIQLAEPSGTLSPSAIDLDSDLQTDMILTVTPGGAVQLFDAEGNAQGTVYEVRQIEDLLGGISTTTDTLLVRVDSITATPAIEVFDDAFLAYFPGGNEEFYQLVYYTSGASYLHTHTLFGFNSVTPVIAGSWHSILVYSSYKSGLVILNEGFDALHSDSLFDGAQAEGLCLLDTTSSSPAFVITDSEKVYLVDVSLTIQWETGIPFIPDFSPITLVHPIDGRTDFAVVSSSGEVTLIDPADGSVRDGFPVELGFAITAPPVAADFDKDSFQELVITGSNRIAAVQRNGVLAANWPLTLDNRKPIEPILSPPAISEMLFDDELRVLFGWPDGSVDARNRWGQQAQGFTKSTGEAVTSAPLILQLDADDAAELLVLDQSGALYCWHLNSLGNFDDLLRPWNGLMNGNQRRGIAAPVAVAIPPTVPGPLVVNKVYPWPNPASDIIHIRYKMGYDGTITARIFDSAGDLVKEISQPGYAGLEEDLIWNLADVSSGVYLARIEAETSAGSEKTFIKIAVIK
ncbi:hypothetical protein CEE37_04355 [candidate division LCP-89 bacterium B3_LCP]|uniref:Secretion system C-terminal sorting domain-containing protein n=1 Tax=candidate division LCP-89 bacterium B3_LCP TaxID=2012998 RepID=A0A532V3L4_UNCL8|nr:MAG: hypothetical protein CEE37_04355 [candidate division LCP-89 bacterium B3_LCP]